jgi:hypothetical protein
MDHLDLIIMGGFFGGGRRKGISRFLVGAAVPPATEGMCVGEVSQFLRCLNSEQICLLLCIIYVQIFYYLGNCRVLNPLKPNGNYMSHLFQQCIYEFHVILRINSNYFAEQH